MDIKQKRGKSFIVHALPIVPYFLLGIVVGGILTDYLQQKLHNKDLLAFGYFCQAQDDLEANNVDSALFYFRKSSCLYENRPAADFGLAKIFLDRKDYALVAYYWEIGISKKDCSLMDTILVSCDLYQVYEILNKKDLAEKELVKIKRFGVNHVADICYIFGKTEITKKESRNIGILRLKTYLLLESRPEKAAQITEIKNLLKNLKD